MQKKYKLTLSDIEAFIDNCSEAASEAYEPYIDFDREPDIISSRLQPALLLPSVQRIVQIFRHPLLSASSDLLNDFSEKLFLPFYSDVVP